MRGGCRSAVALACGGWLAGTHWPPWPAHTPPVSCPCGCWNVVKASCVDTEERGGGKGSLFSWTGCLIWPSTNPLVVHVNERAGDSLRVTDLGIEWSGWNWSLHKPGARPTICSESELQDLESVSAEWEKWPTDVRLAHCHRRMHDAAHSSSSLFLTCPRVLATQCEENAESHWEMPLGADVDYRVAGKPIYRHGLPNSRTLSDWVDGNLLNYHDCRIIRLGIGDNKFECMNVFQQPNHFKVVLGVCLPCDNNSLVHATRPCNVDVVCSQGLRRSNASLGLRTQTASMRFTPAA